MSDKVTTTIIKEKKDAKDKIIMLTAYDYPMAKILDEMKVDMVLVGDSVGNVVLGYENTLPVTMNDMLHHTKAVKRGINRSLLIADMPFMSYQESMKRAVSNAGKLVKKGGADGVKIEGAQYLDRIKAIIDAGIPVMGHLGFTPQYVNEIGGYKVQGKDKKQREEIIKSAKELEKIGVFSLVLEMVPAELAKEISENLSIPVISCGAGPHCDGQVLVTNDILGIYHGESPRFVKRYKNLNEEIKEGLDQYINDVKSGPP